MPLPGPCCAVLLEFAARPVECAEQFAAMQQCFCRQSFLEDQRRGLELQRFLDLPEQAQRIMFDPQLAGKLPGPDVGGPIGTPGIGNRIGQVATLRQLGRDHRSDEGPVVTLLPPLGRNNDGTGVELVTGEMVVVTEMRIRRVGSIHGVDHRQPMSVSSRQRKVFAQSNARRRGLDRLKLATNLRGSLGLHVPGVDMRRTTGEHDHDGRLGRRSSSDSFDFRRPCRSHHATARQAQQTGPRSGKEAAAGR